MLHRERYIGHLEFSEKTDQSPPKSTNAEQPVQDIILFRVGAVGRLADQIPTTARRRWRLEAYYWDHKAELDA